MPGDTVSSENLFVLALCTSMTPAIHPRGMMTFCFSDKVVGA